MQKNKDMKESVRAWQAYADRQSGKHKLKSETKAEDGRPRLSAIPKIEDIRPHMPSSPRSVASVRTPLSIADARRSSPTPIAPLAQLDAGSNRGSVTPPFHDDQGRDRGNIRSGSITPKPRATSRSLSHEQPDLIDLPESALPTNAAFGPNNHVAKHIPSYLQAAVPSSSQTTEDESAEQSDRHQHLAIVDDEDPPLFVSTRSLKRKRGQQARVEQHGSSDGTPVKPFHIKEEPPSSPPNIHNLVRKDTIDLDDPASTTLQTPRHRPWIQAAHSNVTGTLRHSRSGSAPLTQAIKREGTNSTHLVTALSVHVDVDERASNNADVRALSEPSDPAESAANILKQLDPNTVAETDNLYPNKRSRPSELRQQTIHGILSESGEELPPVDENAVRLAPSVARAKLSRRLHGSISPQTPISSSHQTTIPATSNIKSEQSPSSPSGTSRVAQALAKSRLRNSNIDIRPTAESPGLDDRPQWRMQAPESRPKTRKRPSSPMKKQTRLREKPVTELKLQDFKPNPAYNQGYSYAFSETVRKRGDRMCLPGCTNSQCCGSTFRTLAEAQAPLPASQEEALLQDYLGDAYDNMQMTQMESQERQELVLQARTKKMAKEAGKHRQAYERRPTPPGFWRVDFPTTQEQEEDRARAKEQERKVVQERWLEAQRKGGRFIFRDE
jgi:hypothetical protein